METGNREPRVEPLEEAALQFDLEASLFKCGVDAFGCKNLSGLSHSYCVEWVGETHGCYTTECGTQTFGNDLMRLIAIHPDRRCFA